MMQTNINYQSLFELLSLISKIINSLGLSHLMDYTRTYPCTKTGTRSSLKDTHTFLQHMGDATSCITLKLEKSPLKVAITFSKTLG